MMCVFRRGTVRFDFKLEIHLQQQLQSRMLLMIHFIIYFMMRYFCSCLRAADNGKMCWKGNIKACSYFSYGFYYIFIDVIL